MGGVKKAVALDRFMYRGAVWCGMENSPLSGKDRAIPSHHPCGLAEEAPPPSTNPKEKAPTRRRIKLLHALSELIAVPCQLVSQPASPPQRCGWSWTPWIDAKAFLGDFLENVQLGWRPQSKEKKSATNQTPKLWRSQGWPVDDVPESRGRAAHPMEDDTQKTGVQKPE